jgi:hypothetical protein
MKPTTAKSHTTQANPEGVLLPARVSWIDANQVEYEALADRALLNADIYLARRSRTGNRYQQQRPYQGVNWFSNTGTHVWHESLLERNSLLWLDHTSDIVAIAAQPMQMHFPDGTSHYPDFLALHSDQRQVVYNVKPLKFIDAKAKTQFAKAASLCKLVGWSHQIISARTPVETGNLDWLANFRQTRFAPTERAFTQLMNALVVPMPADTAAATMLYPGWTGALASIFHLAWNGDIEFDHTSPISSTSLVRKANS